jgi:O-antigen/teichoic acid export membrane protein
MATLLSATIYFVILTNLLHSTLEVGIVTALNILIWFLVAICILAQPIVNQTPIPAPLAVLKFVPELLARNDRSGAIGVFKASVILALILGLGVTGFLIALPFLMIPLLGGSAVLPIFVQLAGLDVLIISVGQVALATVVALGETKVATRYIWIWSIVRYGLASILLVPLEINGVLAGWILGDLWLVFCSLKRSLRGIGIDPAPSDFSFTEFIRYSLYNLIAALMGFAINQADRLFILTTQGLSHLAVYNVAIVASSIAASAPLSLVMIMLPAVATLYASKKMDDLHWLVRSYTRYVSILVMPIAFGLAAVMEIPLRIFGQDYVSGVIPAVVVSVASGLTAFNMVHASALIALGRLRWYTVANLLGLGGLLVVTAALTPLLGLIGPALGRSSLMIIAAMVYALATLRTGVFEFDWRAYFISIACSTLMAGVVFSAFSLFHTFYAKIAALPLFVVLGVGTYLGSMRVCHLLMPSDIDFIRNLTPRRFHRYLPLIAKLAGVKYVLNRQA